MTCMKNSLKLSELGKNSIKVMQKYMLEECEKFRQLPVYEKLIREEPLKAWQELSIIRVVTPGFIKYFRDYDWSFKKGWNNWKVVKTINDEKFSYFDKNCNLINVLTEMYKLWNNGQLEVYNLIGRLNLLGVNIALEGINPIVMRSLYNIISLKVKFEMNHEIGEPLLGNIMIVTDKSNGEERIVNGNHRCLSYALYAMNVLQEYKPMSVWYGEKMIMKLKKK